MSNTVIQTLREFSILLDAESLPLFYMFKWSPCRQGDRVYFWYKYKQMNGVYAGIRLHRYLVGETRIVDGMVLSSESVVDHIDRNTLNNTLSNLRVCSKQENNINRGISIVNTSGHKGVSWHKGAKKWRATLMLDNKQVHLGFFSDLGDAVLARIEGARKYFGEFYAETAEGVDKIVCQGQGRRQGD